jgi:RNA polymerase sigma factor (sigma-70 family)
MADLTSELPLLTPSRGRGRRLSGPEAPVRLILRSLTAFHRVPHEQLNNLSDEDLIAYVRSARSAGARHDARAAIQILVYGHRRDIERKVRLKMKEHAIDEVADRALVRAVKSSFDGESVGQFKSWLWTIVSREIADWYELQKRRPDEVALPEEHEGNEEIWGVSATVEMDLDAAVDTRRCIDRAMDGLNDQHRRVVELYWLEDANARDTAAQTGETEDNVYQVANRFKRALRKCLEGDRDTSAQRYE